MILPDKLKRLSLHNISLDGLNSALANSWPTHSLTKAKPTKNQFGELITKEIGGTRRCREKGFDCVDLRRPIFMDVGVWMGKADGTAKTSFGLVSGKYVLLCSWLDMEKEGLTDLPTFSTAIEKFFNKTVKLGKDGSLSWYRGHVLAYTKALVELTSPTDLLLILPDLHLHLYTDSPADDFIYNKNFLNPELSPEIVSLDSELYQLISTANEVGAEIVQVGDCFEIWETQMNLLMGGLLPTVLDCDSMKAAIIKKHSKSHYAKSGKAGGLFESETLPFTWLQGNHDNMLNNRFFEAFKTSIARYDLERILENGPASDIEWRLEGSQNPPPKYYQSKNGRIWMEHGHYYDQHNADDVFDDPRKGFHMTMAFAIAQGSYGNFPDLAYDYWKFGIERVAHQVTPWISKNHREHPIFKNVLEDLWPGRHRTDEIARTIADAFGDMHRYQLLRAFEIFDDNLDTIRLVVMGHTHNRRMVDWNKLLQNTNEATKRERQ